MLPVGGQMGRWKVLSAACEEVDLVLGLAVAVLHWVATAGGFEGNGPDAVVFAATTDHAHGWIGPSVEVLTESEAGVEGDGPISTLARACCAAVGLVGAVGLESSP